MFTCSFLCLLRSSDGMWDHATQILFKLGTVLTYAFKCALPGVELK